MNSITLTLTTTTVAGTRGEPSTVVASVTNSASVPTRVVLGVFPPTREGAGSQTTTVMPWTSIDRPLRQIPAGATESYTLTITPPGDAPAGERLLRLIAYDADRAPDEYRDQAQEIRVTVPAIVDRRRGKGIPPWVWALGAAAVVAIAVIAFLTLRPAAGPRPVPTPVATSTLPDGTPSATPANGCPPPFVPRLAQPGDSTCVMPASAQEAEYDNRPEVQARRAFQGMICIPPYESRLASSNDLVCVYGDTAERTQYENSPGYTDHVFADSLYPQTFVPRQ